MNDERKRRGEERRGEERTGEEEKRTAGVLIARWIRLTRHSDWQWRAT